MSELKAFLKDLDLDENLAEDLDKLKDTFHETFVSRKVASSDPDIVTEVTGKRLGSLTTLAKREFGLEPEEVDGKKFEDLITIASKKFKDRLTELESKGNADPSEWEKKYQEALKERDTFKQVVQSKEQEFEEFKSQASKKEKDLKLGYALTGLKGSIEWSETANELAKKGFDAHLQENYVFDFDETGAVQVFGKDGNKILKANKTDHVTPAELLKMEAQKHGLLKMAQKQEDKDKRKDTNEPPTMKTIYGNQPVKKLPTRAAERAGSDK